MSLEFSYDADGELSWLHNLNCCDVGSRAAVPGEMPLAEVAVRYCFSAVDPGNA